MLPVPKWVKRLQLQDDQAIAFGEEEDEKKAQSTEGEPNDKPIPGLVAQPPGIGVKLYRYQLESLTWMRKIEERVNKGSSYLGLAMH